MRLVLGLSLIGQFVLHVRYGGEIFLYAMHWWALLVPMVALSALTRLRPLALGCAAVFVVTASLENLRQWHTAISALAGDFASVPKRGHVCDDYVWSGSSLFRVAAQDGGWNLVLRSQRASG